MNHRVDCRDCDWSDAFDEEQQSINYQIMHELGLGHRTDRTEL